MYFESGEYSVAPVYFLPELHRKFCSGFTDTFIGGFSKNAESLIEQAFLYLRHGMKVLFVDMLQGTLQGVVVECESGAYFVISGSIPVEFIHYHSKAPFLSGACPKKGTRFLGCVLFPAGICPSDANGLSAFFFSSISAFNCS